MTKSRTETLDEYLLRKLERAQRARAESADETLIESWWAGYGAAMQAVIIKLESQK